MRISNSMTHVIQCPHRQETIHRASIITNKPLLLRFASEKGESFGMAVKDRLEGTSDLVAEEAIYHSKCYCHPYQVHDVSG